MGAPPAPEYRGYAYWPDGGTFTAHASEDIDVLKAKIDTDLDRLRERNPKAANRVIVVLYRKVH